MSHTKAHLATALGLLVGTTVDAIVGDPQQWHPVAGLGGAASAVEARVYGDSRARGFAFTAICVGSATGLGVALQHFTHSRPVARAFVTAAATWVVIGSRSLAVEADALGRTLASDDLAAARRRLPHLVGRDPSQMSGPDIARATVESVAENTSDAMVAPLWWGAVAGIPGLLGYRAVNTLDAMVGHRSPRYERFGWASARLDDVANLIPARLTAAAVAAISGRPSQVWRETRQFARQHPSPNSGWCEAAFAAALGIRLGGRNVYAGRIERRPLLGSGGAPRAADVPRARRLLRRTTIVATLGAAGLATVRLPWRSILRHGLS